VSCPLCRNERRPRFVLRAHGSDLVRCRRCGLVRVEPMPAAAAALGLYEATYYRDPERGYVDYVADEAVFRAEFRRRLRVLRAAGARGALLDVGCASGALLREAAAAGFEPSGIEPSAEMARQAAARTGLPVRAGSIEDALVPAGRYDVVTLFDVLEHLVDPVPVLVKLRRGLVPGGLLAVTVPDFGGLWARLSGRHWPFVTPWEHLLYFTRGTLGEVLCEAGFADVRFARAQTPLSFGTLAAQLPFVRGLVPAALRHRGFGLPMGTLYAIARN